MKNEDIEIMKNFRYPNLIAEVINSGEAADVAAQHINQKYKSLGMKAPNVDADILWKKICGFEPIWACEASALSGFFRCSPSYLFDHELFIVEGHSLAFWRRLDTNESGAIKDTKEVASLLRKYPGIAQCTLNYVNEKILEYEDTLYCNEEGKTNETESSPSESE